MKQNQGITLRRVVDCLRQYELCFYFQNCKGRHVEGSPYILSTSTPDHFYEFFCLLFQEILLKSYGEIRAEKNPQ